MGLKRAFRINKDNRYMVIDSRTQCVHIVKASSQHKANHQVLKSTIANGIAITV